MAGMRMARRCARRRNEGLFELAVRSDWKVSVAIAAASVFGAAVLVPALFGATPALRPLATVITQFAWLLAFVFAWIAAIRLFSSGEKSGGAGPAESRAGGRSA